MSIEKLAYRGGTPAFKTPKPVGQLFFPTWDQYKKAMHGIFQRQYYTNQGCLTDLLERKLQSFLGVNHVICVTNATVGLMMAAEALELSGKVLMPAQTFIATPLSALRCGLEPVFCDVDLETHHITPETLEEAFVDGVSAVLGVHLWGSAADINGVKAWATERDLKVYWDSAQSMGCKINDQQTGRFASIEVFSLHATKIVSAGEGGCITTSDGALAEKLRNIRSSYGIGEKVDVVKTANGRMSEFQAAMALLSLENYKKNLDHNSALRSVYAEYLKGINGITLEPLHGVTSSNKQSIVVRVDPNLFGMNRDTLMALLKSENILARRYFYPGAHRTGQFKPHARAPLPNTDILSDRILALPIGGLISEHDVQTICGLIKIISQNG